MELIDFFKSIPIKIAIKSESFNNSGLIAIGVRPIGLYSQLPIKTKGDQ
jgi:hypothetical protein